jgi:hypothetical protein
MNALHWITTEAKKIKRRYPHRFKKWTEYVAQASAIYASKHRGKSPVGHKHKKINGMASRKRSHAKKRSKTVRRIKRLHAAEGRAIRNLGSIAGLKTKLKKKLEDKIAYGLLSIYKARTKRAKKKIAKRVNAEKRQLKNLK